MAVGLLLAFHIPVETHSLAVALALMGFLGGAYIVYGRARPAPVLSNLCGGIGALAWAGGMAGIISLAGLRYGAPMIDAHLAGLDRALGVDTTRVVMTVASSPAASRLLGLAYESSFPLLGCLIIFLGVTRRFDKLWTLVFVFAASIVVCTTISVLIPARGAFAYYGHPAELLDLLPPGAGLYHLPKLDYYRYDPAPVISFAHLQGVVTFPSFHCCLALMTVAACHGLRWIAPLSVVWNVLVIVSTVPVGGHYAIDLPMGCALWCASALAAAALLGRQERSPIATPSQIMARF